MKKTFRPFSGRRLNPTRIVAGSFAAIILAGALLLCLPIASASGQSPGFFQCLFTATSATCVTGLIVVDTAVQWSFFGEVVILVMIQLGGLGFMTMLTLFSLMLHRRIGLSERLIMVSTLNLNSMGGVVRLVRHTLQGTLLFEGVGALLLATRFIPKFGFAQGLWKSIFHAVSAFCNAGFDLMGTPEAPMPSLSGYWDDPVVLLTLMALVAIGGLGFVVWEDIRAKRRWRTLTLYSKLVLGMTAGLILTGTLFFLAVEYGNPATLGNMPLGEKILNALFQSVTLRTAGFNVIDQGAMTDSAQAVSILLMLIGGSSGSTAGGIKTATIGVLLLSLRAGLQGRSEVILRGRAIPQRRVLSANTLVLVVMLLFLTGSIALSLADGVPYLAAAYEVASALGTVGVTTGITTGLSLFSKALLILFMYLGRVGILSFSIAFLMGRASEDKLKYPEMDMIIG